MKNRIAGILASIGLAIVGVVTIAPPSAEAATTYHIRNSSNSDDGGVISIHKTSTVCSPGSETLIRFPGQEADSTAWDSFRLGGDVNAVDANVSITKGGTNEWITTRYYTQSRLCIKAYDTNDYLVTITRVY